MTVNTKKKLLFVIYDGIKNSVFQSQVLLPLLKRLKTNPDIEITLVSFETHRITQKKILELIPAHPRLHIVMHQRIPFFSQATLWFGVYFLRKYLSKNAFDKIIARGPLAGFIVMKSLGFVDQKPETFMVQARGLCAQEYRYAHLNAKQPFYKTLIHKWIYKALDNVEHNVYGNTSNAYDFLIESVSPALKDYLVKTFNSTPESITIASKDIPSQVCNEKISAWKAEVRKELEITPDASVYCYSGSFKPWQCVPETITYFAKQYEKNKSSFMLILSQDKKQFEQAFTAQNIPKSQYAITCVQQNDLFKYLAAADFGMLFREKDVINWVSRPTKMLEYQAAGLKIVHNNTVAWLVT